MKKLHIKNNLVSLRKGWKLISKENILEKIRSKKMSLSGMGVSTIGLFGSYLNDSQSDKSDIDILIDFEPEKENFDNYMAAWDLLEDLFRNQKVDIVTKNGLSSYIGPKILSEVIYA